MLPSPEDAANGARRIDVHDPADVAYWRKALDATHEELVSAVAKVGDDAAAVSAFLKRGSDAEPPPVAQLPDGG